MIRVFPRRTKWTPTDELSFIGFPPLFLPPEQPVRISVTFTWDIPLAVKIFHSWLALYSDVQVGGPALDDAGEEFIPGRFLKEGVTITSRGCIRHCSFCLVPWREGPIREYPIKPGWIIQDNNLLACSRTHIEEVFEMLQRQPKPIELSGLDARLLRPWHIDLIKTVNLEKLWIAQDNDQMGPLWLASDLLSDIPKHKKFCYVLIGFEDDTIPKAEQRLRQVWELGFYPFAMLYRGPDGEGHKNTKWKRFQRTWCRPAAYKTMLKNNL